MGYLILDGAFFLICLRIPTNVSNSPSGYVYESILLKYQTLFYSLLAIILFSYPIYLIIRFLIWMIKAFKEKKINKSTLKRILKVAFNKENLIRVILILGILYLSVSLLKSCGIINIKHSTYRSGHLRLLNDNESSNLKW